MAAEKKWMPVEPGIYTRDGATFRIRYYSVEAKGSRWAKRGPFDSIEEAREEKRALEVEQDDLRKGNRRETVGQFAARWLNDFPRKASTTMVHYEERVKPFVAEFKDRPMGSFERREIREWAQQPGNRTRVPALRAMFNNAHDDKIYVGDNPFVGLGLKQSKGRSQITVLEPHEVAALVAMAKRCHDGYGEKVFGPMVQVAAYTAMRVGEIMALRWSDIDFAKDEIRVARSYRSTTQEMALPKNQQARRIVLAPQAKSALLKVPRVKGDNLVFRTTRGKPYTGRVHHYYWDPVRSAFLASLPEDHELLERVGRAANQEALSFHDLRHFAASYMLNIGMSREDVAIQLGHQDGGRLVGELYGHMNDELARERIRQAFLEHVDSAPKRPGRRRKAD